MPKLHREVRNATAGKPGILAYLSLGLLMVVLTLVRLCRRRRKFSAKQLDAYHDWKKGTAEGKLESKLARMQQKLEGMRSRRKVEEGRDAHERLLKPRSSASDVEVRTLQTEARNARAVDAERALDRAENGAAKPKKPPPPPGPPPATLDAARLGPPRHGEQRRPRELGQEVRRAAERVVEVDVGVGEGDGAALVAGDGEEGRVVRLARGADDGDLGAGGRAAAAGASRDDDERPDARERRVAPEGLEQLAARAGAA
ncbi:hypothetical protein JL720_17151 [Aureococcus anophagefferens]|nr:hypothetical protein JL720_17151 [Aureococcus anophagefferens]